MPRLALLTSHPIQYYSPLFRELAKSIDLHVFYAHRATPGQQAAAGFDAAFDWDVDLTSGHSHSFLTNVATRPGTDRFSGCDTPEISERLAEGRFDAVLAFGWRLKSLLQGIWAGKRLGLPVLVRGDSQLAGPRGPLKRAAKALAYPAFLRMFDAALYVGRRNHAYYRRYLYPKARLFFSPHCVDTGWFAARATASARQALRGELGLAATDKAVLFAGKLIPLKRPLDLVEACAVLRREGVPAHLLIAGSGVLEQDMRARAEALEVPASFLGFCNQSRMPAAYAAADMLALVSQHETWGLVANEALACARPIVVSDAAGCAGDLADGSVGRVYRVGDIAGLARAIRETAREPPDVRAIAALSDRYSLRAAASGIFDALEAVTRRAPSLALEAHV